MKILRDTPFHKSGEVIDLWAFKVNYGDALFVGSYTTTELIQYLQGSLPSAIAHSDMRPEKLKEWFQLIPETDEEPLAAYINGSLYTKELDGMYHKWANEHHRLSVNEAKVRGDVVPDLGEYVQIHEIRIRIREAKFSQMIPHYYSNPNAKL